MAEGSCTLYVGAGKSTALSSTTGTKYWGDAKIADVNSGSIRQAAIDLYPNAKNSARATVK
jgi:hypothetical protein